MKNENTNEMKQNLKDYERKIQEKKHFIFKTVINCTLEYLKKTNESFINGKHFNLSDVKSCVLICKLIIHKSENEYQICKSEEEKKTLCDVNLFLKYLKSLKIFSHKCLNTIIEKTETIFQLKEE